MSEYKESLFNKFSPKTNFFMGLGGGILALIVIGFFILLAVVFSGDGLFKDKPADLDNKQVDQVDSAGTPQAALEARPNTDFKITEADHVRGDFDAPITIVEFSDFECPFCQRFHPTVQKIIDEYPKKVRWVYKHFPLSSIHTKAQVAAEASECAAEQGGNNAFWAYGDALFENQSQLSRELYVRLAIEQGLNVNDFEDCIDSGKMQQKVQSDYQRGISAGVRGTPGSFINGQSIPGAVPYEQIKSIVDSLL